MAPDAFVIGPRGRNVFIVGPDTGRGERLESGGTSAGTANGVYTFLERYVDVRWLMPGEAGADVPKRTGRAGARGRRARSTGVRLSATPAHAERERGRGAMEPPPELGYSLALNHSHNWQAIGPEVFETHPDWFAASKGQRLKPGTDTSSRPPILRSSTHSRRRPSRRSAATRVFARFRSRLPTAKAGATAPRARRCMTLIRTAPCP